MAKNKKGFDKVEYPKLIKIDGKKVRVLNAEDEAKYDQPKETKKAWGKDKQHLTFQAGVVKIFTRQPENFK